MKLPEFLIDHPDGEIRLVGHRIGLYTVVRDYREGISAEQMAEEYPSLPLDLIRKVIAFYLENRAEVNDYVDACQAELDRQASALPGPGVIKIRQLMELIQLADVKHTADPEWSQLSAMEKLQRIRMESGTEVS